MPALSDCDRAVRELGDDDEHWWTQVPAETLQSALTLAQSTWWVDSESTPHLVDAMAPEHRDAVIDYLVLRTRSLLVDVQETAVRARAGSVAERSARSLLAANARQDTSDAWLETTPLMIRLRQLSGRRG